MLCEVQRDRKYYASGRAARIPQYRAGRIRYQEVKVCLFAWLGCAKCMMGLYLDAIRGWIVVVVLSASVHTSRLPLCLPLLYLVIPIFGVLAFWVPRTGRFCPTSGIDLGPPPDL